MNIQTDIRKYKYKYKYSSHTEVLSTNTILHTFTSVVLINQTRLWQVVISKYFRWINKCWPWSFSLIWFFKMGRWLFKWVHPEILYLYYDERRDIRWNSAWALGHKGSSEGGARGISRGLRLYFTMYPNLSHNTDILNFKELCFQYCPSW